jgi:hypothetical protein
VTRTNCSHGVTFSILSLRADPRDDDEREENAKTSLYCHRLSDRKLIYVIVGESGSYRAFVMKGECLKIGLKQHPAIESSSS